MTCKSRTIGLFGVTLLLVSLIATTALAQEGGAPRAVGRIGVGYTHGNAPLGVRMWFSPQFGFDAGLGLVLNGEEQDWESTDPDDTTTTMDFGIDLGFLMGIYRNDNSIFFARIGLNLDRRYANGREEDGDPVYSSAITINVSGMAGIEIFLGALGLPELALQGGVGVGFENYSGPEQPGDEDTDWSFGSLSTGISIVSSAQLGFHYYF